ncbi:ArsR/SmtB family transcription factor [Cohnella sp. 56]|uniref:ArsR/SmtB family transcription factor n=1 Tax=Cohnella sp. 56 TaxID=3113722 RepID=UPI0030EACB69
MEDKLSLARQLNYELYRQLAGIGKSLSSDKRLEILNLLSQGSKTVERLALSTHMTVANVSRHLQVLLEAKLVKFVKNQTYVIYSLADPAIIDFMSSLWRLSEKQLPDIAS